MVLTNAVGRQRDRVDFGRRVASFEGSRGRLLRLGMRHIPTPIKAGYLDRQSYRNRQEVASCSRATRSRCNLFASLEPDSLARVPSVPLNPLVLHMRRLRSR